MIPKILNFIWRNGVHFTGFFFTLDIEMAVPFEPEKLKRGVVGIKCVLVMKGVMKGFWNYF